MNLPLVSIIITTKNEEKNIENCLKSILHQTYPRDKIEIIVVDKDSTDKTKKVANKYTSKVFNLSNEVTLSNIKNYRGAQLNLGVEKAKGEIIFFPDADMTFDRELLKEAVILLNKFDALYVPESICGKGIFGKIRDFERSFYNQTCIDGVRIIKKDFFLKAGGVDVKNIVFGPDDWDFTKTLKKEGAKLGISQHPLFHHEEWMTWKVYLRKKRKYINTFDDYINKWGRDDPDLKKQFGFWYRFFGVFIEEGKWRKLLVHPMIAVGMYFLKAHVGYNFLRNKYGKFKV